MNRILIILSLLLGGGLSPLYAQSAAPTEADDPEFHYRDGAYGYRAEAALMDSLAVLEMMGEITPAQAEQQQENFRKKKKDKQRKKRKQKKSKQKKGTP